MARKATSMTKDRMSRQQALAVGVAGQGSGELLRRGRKPKLDTTSSANLSPVEAVAPGSEEPQLETAGAQVPPVAKARRGRKPPMMPMPEPGETSDDGMAAPQNVEARPEDASDATPEATPVQARRSRKPKSQPDLLAPAPQAEQSVQAPEFETSNAGQADVEPAATAPSAARWDAATGTASFDWPSIEQVATTEGPNQAMAKLLLAARAEGANSRWPF